MTVKEVTEMIAEHGIDTTIDWLLMVGYIESALLVIHKKNESEYKLYKEQLT